MRDASTGTIMWEHSDWQIGQEETTAQIPREILKCKQVSREINFSSAEMMSSLRLVQTVLYNNSPLEEWRFSFGFVIPNSTNTWQQTIEAADEGDMFPPEVLSGKVMIHTAFYDGDTMLVMQKI